MSKRSTNRTETHDWWIAFASALGWMAMIGRDNVVKQLTFGHSSRSAAIRALGGELIRCAEEADWNPKLVTRLQAFASGKADRFLDVEVDCGPVTEFQRRVLDACRRIPPGRTLTYGQLAAEARSPGAARAVGNCMARNRIPLVIPCHRVVAASGSLGGFSAPGGIAVKRRLLELEAAV